MTIREIFERHFSEQKLRSVFNENIIYSKAIGIDSLDPKSFERQIDTHIEILSRKATLGNYAFSKYKLKLISKGRGKVPREISIPTVRDRIALRAICEFLAEIYQDVITFDLPQNIIKNLKSHIDNDNYDTCIKLDVANFYPSVKHKEVMSRLGSKIRDPKIKALIHSAISTPTVTASKASDSNTDRGIPQGLAISNILAALYLKNIDKQLKSISDIQYYRYVDDVLIFCNSSNSTNITKLVISKFKRIGLDIYDPEKAPEKSSIGPISNGFSYLGYSFKNSVVTSRISSVEKLKESLVSIFTSYKHSQNKSTGFLQWRLNLRVTGCIYENKRKGWLFFFSEINDESLLYSLDNHIKKLERRFGLPELRTKRFVRAFKELTFRKYETNYIPNFDKYTLEQMKGVLVKFFDFKNIDNYSEKAIRYEFKKRISKQIRDLQTDLQNFS
jgi:retron-type reverse transcriptase